MRFEIGWSSPANIAFTKYWGKKGHQLPCNSSLSLTLSKCRTEMFMEAVPSSGGSILQDFKFEGATNEKFSQKVENVLIQFAQQSAPWLKDLSLTFESRNSFPHSSGIASSASSMSALALCLTSLEKSIGLVANDISFLQQASSLARRASGSASRSLMPKMGLWGQHPDVLTSNDQWAVEYKNYHPLFEGLRDAVLVISSEEKSVPSSAGHQEMALHPYALARFNSAQQNNHFLFQALANGDWDLFTSIIEREALALHAMMLTGVNPYFLLAPGSLAAINHLKKRRSEEKLPIAFTIDAGPNIHLLYPKEAEVKVEAFIASELVSYCENEKIIYDQMGIGPVEIPFGR